MSHTPPVRASWSRTLLLLVVAALLVPLAPTQRADASTETRVMRPSLLTPAQMASWFHANEPKGSSSRASVPISELTRLFVEEGRVEGVAGDLAFVQSVLETGWFRWGAGQVTPGHNNFSGIGACDGGHCTVARFPTARIGVRAQIHHLRAYADPTVTPQRLANPLESPRFHLVNPKGMAPTWEQFGGGVWATDPNYASKILRLYHSMLAHTGVVGRFLDVPPSHTHALAIESLEKQGVTTGCRDGRRYCPGSDVTREQVATFLTRSFELPTGTAGAFGDVSGVHRAGVDSLSGAGLTEGCSPGRFCPKASLTRAQMASLIARTLELPPGEATFADVPARNPHAGAIAAIADEGITLGCGKGRFCPSETVDRGQMASFLDRAMKSHAAS